MAAVFGLQYSVAGGGVYGAQYTATGPDGLTNGPPRLPTRRSKLKAAKGVSMFSSFDTDEDIHQALQMLMPLFQLGVFNG